MYKEVADEDIVEDALELLGGPQDVDSESVADETDEAQDALDDDGQDPPNLFGDDHLVRARSRGSWARVA